MSDLLGVHYCKIEHTSTEVTKLIERYVNEDGMVIGWGVCRDGELGTCNTYNYITPFPIASPDKAIRVACTSLSSVWLGVRNYVLTMGNGMWGELGIGNPRFSPQVTVNECNSPIALVQIEMARPIGEDVIIDVTGACSHITCVTIGGAIYAWGANNYGQCHPDLSNACCGYAQRRVIRNEVVVQVASSNFASIARTMSGAVYGWGLSMLLGNEDDLMHQLSENNMELTPVPNEPNRRIVSNPVRFMGLEGKRITYVAAGPWHFAAVNCEGEVYTWGMGNNGRLGHGDTNDQIEPTVVAALEGIVVIEVACGCYHTVFVSEDGDAFACGDNQAAQCGLLGVYDVTIPKRIPVTGRRQVSHASCGRTHTHLLLTTGEVVVYGSGLGLGVGVGYGLRQVRCQPVMHNYTTLWTTSNVMHGFGLVVPKSTCMLVLGMPHRGVPCELDSIGLKDGILSCGVGSGFTLLVSRRGSSYSFGMGGWGQLGVDVSSASHFTPERVPVLTHATRIQFFARCVVTYVAAGFSFSMAITEGERVFAWGSNSYSQCGLGVDPADYPKIPFPQEITWLADKQVIQVACGSYFALALTASGTVYSWGIVDCCGVGSDPVKSKIPAHMVMNKVGSEKRRVIISPVRVSGLSNIIQVAAGGWHALALNSIGEIYAWGLGSGGRLGLGGSSTQTRPFRIDHPAVFTRIGCGCYTSYGIDDDANLYLWGVNERHQLGRRGKVDTPHLALENVKDVCLGKYFTLALTFRNTFHMAGVLECTNKTYKTDSFRDTDALPTQLKPRSLRENKSVGLRLYAGLEHAIVLAEVNAISSNIIGEATHALRRQPQAIIERYTMFTEAMRYSI